MNTNFNSNNEVLSFFIYMWNKFSFNECMDIWEGDTENPYDTAHYMWNKYMEYVEDFGTHGGISMFVSALDDTNLNILVNRACSIYNGRKYRE